MWQPTTNKVYHTTLQCLAFDCKVVLVLLNACPLARDLVMQIGDWARSSSNPTGIYDVHSWHFLTGCPTQHECTHYDIAKLTLLLVWPGSCVCSSDATQRRTAVHGYPWLHGYWCDAMGWQDFQIATPFGWWAFTIWWSDHQGTRLSDDDLLKALLWVACAQCGRRCGFRYGMFNSFCLGLCCMALSRVHQPVARLETTAVATKNVQCDSFLLFTWGLLVVHVRSFPAWDTWLYT